MSLPDYLVLAPDGALPPGIDGFPHRIVLLPSGTDAAKLSAVHHSGAFLIEPECAREALNDNALDLYIQKRMAVWFYARRARDLRPILRRAEAFRARGYALEVLP